MITTRLTDGYFIEIEGVDHVLKRSVMTQPKDKSKAPRETIKSIGYFSSLKNALERYLKLVQSQQGDALSLTMEEYIDKIAEINAATVERIINTEA